MSHWSEAAYRTICIFIFLIKVLHIYNVPSSIMVTKNAANFVALQQRSGLSDFWIVLAHAEQSSCLSWEGAQCLLGHSCGPRGLRNIHTPLGHGKKVTRPCGSGQTMQRGIALLYWSEHIPQCGVWVFSFNNEVPERIRECSSGTYCKCWFVSQFVPVCRRGHC